MWNELLTALALVLVLEGILPFLAPAQLRRTLLELAQAPDRRLRIIGFVSMVVGVLLLYAVH